MTTNAPHANDEKSYLGHMNCDLITEKPAIWQYYDDAHDNYKWVDAQYPLCV